MAPPKMTCLFISFSRLNSLASTSLLLLILSYSYLVPFGWSMYIRAFYLVAEANLSLTTLVEGANNHRRFFD